MENVVAMVPSDTVHNSAASYAAHSFKASAPAISPEKLANLNFGIFRTLRSLGTEQDRICAAMGLNSSEFDYLAQLA